MGADAGDPPPSRGLTRPFKSFSERFRPAGKDFDRPADRAYVLNEAYRLKEDEKMTELETRRYEMLVRVRDFGETHGNLFPESGGTGTIRDGGGSGEAVEPACRYEDVGRAGG